MTRIRKVVALFALAAALAFPTGVLAAESDADETMTVNSYVLLSGVPSAAIDYGAIDGGVLASELIPDIFIATNDADGMTFVVSGGDLTGTPSGTILASARAFEVDGSVGPNFEPGSPGSYTFDVLSTILVPYDAPAADYAGTLTFAVTAD